MDNQYFSVITLVILISTVLYYISCSMEGFHNNYYPYNYWNMYNPSYMYNQSYMPSYMYRQRMHRPRYSYYWW